MKNTTDRTAAATGRGFTLVEILITIVLIGILSAVVVVGIGRLTENASTASCTASADAARAAVNAYYASNGAYPASFTDLTNTTASGGPPLVVPGGVTAAARTLSTSSWTLTMSATNPPTFACSPGTSASTSTSTSASTSTSTSTTAAATTTTTVARNGVTAAASIAGTQLYYGENIISLSNSAVITAMSVTIVVVQTPGETYSGQYTDFWGGTVTSGHSTSPSAITYTFDLIAGQTIVAGSWKIDAQTLGTGTLHPTSGDTWRVTTTSQGITQTLSGTF